MVFELQLISEPLYHHTWSCLNHYQYNEAIFTAERIFAENPHDETAVHLLATCIYRDRGPKQTKLFLLKQEKISVKSRFLLAKCYMDIGQYPEAEDVLVGPGEFEGPSEIVITYKDTAPFVLKLLADIFKRSDRKKNAINCLRKCLELNPLSWGAYTDLVDLCDNVDPSDIFTLPKNVVLNNQTCLRALCNKINIGEILHHTCPSKKRSDIHDSQEDLSISLENVNPKIEEKSTNIANNDLSQFMDETLLNSVDPNDSNYSNAEHLCTTLLADTTMIQTNDSNFQKTDYPKQLESCKKLEELRSQFGNANLDPSLTTYEFVSVVTSNFSNVNTRQIKLISPKNQVLKDNFKKNRHNCKKDSKLDKINLLNIPTSKVDVINSSGISSVPIWPLDYDSGKISEVKLDNVDIKEIQSPRTRLQSTKAALAIKSNTNQFVYSTDECCSHTSIATDIRLQSALCYLKLLAIMGQVYKCAKNYKFFDAISRIKDLPKHHSETGLVSSWLASAHMEMSDQYKAYTVLSDSFKNEPWQLHGVPLFSSILWLLNKEKELLFLSLEMMEMDQGSAEIWCVMGNAMSLNKEYEVAIRYFQRAIQINSSYAYAYILLGHEYSNQGELDKALTSYYKASLFDSHSSASYFIAGIYTKQENLIGAEHLLKEILKSFPESLMALTNLAVIHAKLRPESLKDSLDLLENACRVYPNEAICRYHKAVILYKCSKYQDALKDLEMMEPIKDARLYLLVSSVHEHLGNHCKATLYKNWAMELDPKCTYDSFIVDSNLLGSAINSDNGGSSAVTVPSSRFLSGHRNLEATQNEFSSNDQTNYD